MGLTFRLGQVPLAIFTDSSNNVGIGAAASGSYKLQVTGTTNLTGALSGTSATFSGNVTSDDVIFTAGTLFGAGNTGFSNRASDTTLYLQMPATGFNITDNALNTRFILSSTGAATFSSSVTADSLVSNGGGQINTTVSPFVFFNSGGGGNAKKFGLNMTNLDGFKIYSLNDNGTTRKDNIIFANIDGNVGIGTSSPHTLLTISGPASTVYGINLGTQTPNWPSVSRYIGIGNSNGSIAANSGFSGVEFGGPDSADEGYLAFHTHDNLVASGERMRITKGGNVGIGTTSPSQRLSVSAASAGYVFLSENSRNVSGDLNTLINLGNNANNTSSYFVVCSMASGDKMYVYGNGNIVNTNNSYGTLSDATLKENIIDATPKLADILQLKVRNFNLIGDDTKQIGFIAQEFEEVFPSMIDIDGKSGKKAIKTSVLVPMLVKAIQEQTQIIKDLEARIKQLENK
jgi:hypothetical protein